MTTPANDELQKSFRTHAHHLRAFTQLAGYDFWPKNDDATTEAVGSRVAGAFPACVPPRTADYETLAKCLNRGWGTELLLNLGAMTFDEDELVRLSNSWGSVQTYYVGYAATQALIVAEGRPRPTDHPRTQKAWEAEERARVAAGKRPRKTPQFPTMCKLTPAESETAEAKVRVYTMLDYLYRLRVKANYEEAGMFTEGPDNEHVSRLVALDMVRIASAIMVAHEVRIAKLLGKATVVDLANDWVLKHSPPPDKGIAGRLAMLDRIL